MKSMISCFVALLFVLVYSSAGVLASPVLADNFNDNALNPNLWSVESPPPGFSGIVSEKNQRLEIALGPGHGGTGIVSAGSLAGNFDVQVDYKLLNWPPSNPYGLRLGAVDLGVGPFSEVGMYRNSSAGHPLEFYTLAFADRAIQITTTDTAGTLRLLRVGSTLSGYVNNGANWVIVGSGTAATNATRFNLDVSTSDPQASGNIVIAFDNFKVNAGNGGPAHSIEDVLRNSVKVSLGPGNSYIEATFQPNFNLSLQQAAQLGGYDHFNWLQYITADTQVSIGLDLICPSGLKDLSGDCPKLPYIDPPHGGYQYQLSNCLNLGFQDCRNRLADNLDWYLSENFPEGYNPNTLLERNMTSSTLDFFDSPATKYGANITFHTALVGVRQGGSGDVLSFPGTTFDWEFVGSLLGNNTIELRSNTHPVPGSGEVYRNSKRTFCHRRTARRRVPYVSSAFPGQVFACILNI